jgi:hypothetical protein
MAEAAKRVSGAAAETLFSADFGPLKTELVRAPSLAIVLLLVVTTLGVYKPWGLTRYGQRKQQERRKVQQQRDYEIPLGVKIFFAVIGVLVLVFVVLHLTGHGFGGTATEGRRSFRNSSPTRFIWERGPLTVIAGEELFEKANQLLKWITLFAG